MKRLAEALAGRYQVERELGAGGMATVYQARDLRHDRDVAIKVLHPELAAALGAERFLSEIKTTARLQHPHILPLLDSGEAGGLLYYVMPLATGETLRQKLTRERQLSIPETLRIVREVADAVGHAHGLGIIHRDIKPENILLQGGHALVADFGIALAVQSAGQRMTQTGLSLGTPQYMSPEQAMGDRTIDARSDVYALGAVAYEMLTGEPPFSGATVQAIVAKVLTERPTPPSAVRDTVPPAMEGAVLQALAKLPADRFASTAEFAAALTDGTSLTARTSGARAAATPGTRDRKATVALGLALGAAIALGAWGWLRRSPELPVTRAFLKFPVPEAPSLADPSYALVPDGSAMVYIGAGSRGSQIWVRKRSELNAVPVAGTEGARTVFISPDGAWIGYLTADRLLKVPVVGGTAIALADASCLGLNCQGQASGAFLDDGRVLFQSADALVAVPAGGGKADTLVTSAMVLGFAPLHPAPVRGSRFVLFTACVLYCHRADLWIVDLTTSKARRLVPDAHGGQYDGHGRLLYVDQSGTAFAAPFDPQSGEIRGAAVPVLSGITGTLALSSAGTLLYAAGDASPQSQLVIVSRDGLETPVDTSWQENFVAATISPDGQRIAAAIIRGSDQHLWVKEVGKGPPARLTFEKGQFTNPAWSADSRWLFYTHFQGDTSTFNMRTADGAGGEVVLRRGSDWVIESAASRDGDWLVTREYRTNGTRDIYARRLQGDTATRPVVSSTASDFSPTLSPDGKWLAYSNEETGRPEIWVVPFPDPGGARWQVSTRGGWEPTWSPNGKELHYMTSAGLAAVLVGSRDRALTSGEERILFQVDAYRRFPTHRAYDVMPGGRGFLMIRSGSPAARDLVLVDNWFTELEAKLR